MIGLFLKVSITNFLTKVAKIFGNFLTNLKNITGQIKASEALFWATFGKIWLLFTPASCHTATRQANIFAGLYDSAKIASRDVLKGLKCPRDCFKRVDDRCQNNSSFAKVKMSLMRTTDLTECKLC